jgi:hypothetical protein
VKKTVFAAISLASSPAFADVCDHGREIVRCYHPTAAYRSCEAKSATDATLYFAGGLTGKPYQMDVNLQNKNGFFRVEIKRDTAIAPPNRRCSLENWNPITSY